MIVVPCPREEREVTSIQGLRRANEVKERGLRNIQEKAAGETHAQSKQRHKGKETSVRVRMMDSLPVVAV